jgi:hypothetical protein
MVVVMPAPVPPKAVSVLLLALPPLAPLTVTVMLVTLRGTTKV